MGMVWKAKSDAPLNGIAPEIVGRVKQEVAAACGGVVPPAEFLAKIAPPEHPAHGLAEWDDRLAGHQHRLEQVAKVIQTVVAVYEAENPTVDYGGIVATVRDPDGTEARFRGYLPVYEVLSNQDYTRQAERRLLRSLVGDLRNHSDLPLAAALLAAVQPIADAWEEANRK